MTKDPEILHKRQRTRPETKIIDAHIDIPESSLSVYFELAKIKWRKGHKIIHQINKAYLRIMQLDNFV